MKFLRRRSVPAFRSVAVLAIALSSVLPLAHADTVTDAVTQIQSTDPTLPSGVTNPKGTIGTILANLFWKATDGGYDSSKLGKIKPAYLDGIGFWTQTASGTWLTDPTSKVGIGVTLPTSKLHVGSGSNMEGVRIISSNYSPLIVRNSADSADLFRIDQNGTLTVSGSVGIGTNSPSYPFQLNTPAGANTVASMVTDGTVQLESWIGGSALYAGVGTRSNHGLSLFTNNVDRVRIDTSGNVGIGTATPAYKLDVQGTSTGLVMQMGSGAQTSYSDFILNSDSGNGQIWKAGSQYPGVAWGGPSSFNVYNSSGSINFHPHSIANAMVLATTGYVGINTAAPSERLEVNGNVKATAFYYSSDRRLKTDITPIEGALEKIRGLNGYGFTWKSDGRRDIGVIAQEVEGVFPEAVHTSDTTGFKSVEYGNLVAPIIEAVKTLADKVDGLFGRYLDQQKEIDTLKSQNAELLQRVENLESRSK